MIYSKSTCRLQVNKEPHIYGTGQSLKHNITQCSNDKNETETTGSKNVNKLTSAVSGWGKTIAQVEYNASRFVSLYISIYYYYINILHWTDMQPTACFNKSNDTDAKLIMDRSWTDNASTKNSEFRLLCKMSVFNYYKHVRKNCIDSCYHCHKACNWQKFPYIQVKFLPMRPRQFTAVECAFRLRRQFPFLYFRKMNRREI